jgi:hypothetical protein
MKSKHTPAPPDDPFSRRNLAMPANPLAKPPVNPVVDLTALDMKTMHRKQLNTKRREIRDLRRKQTAAEALAGLDKATEIFGFTKGQFSIIDLLDALLAITGPAEQLDVSTWTAANTDVTTVLGFVNRGLVMNSRWLVDLTFQRRSPQLAQRIRQTFGPDSIRVARNHAKFSLVRAGDWRVVIRTSMNLNFNPRFEDFTLAHDPELYDFITGILDAVWTAQAVEMAEERPYDIHKHFDTDL